MREFHHCSRNPSSEPASSLTKMIFVIPRIYHLPTDITAPVLIHNHYYILQMLPPPASPTLTLLSLLVNRQQFHQGAVDACKRRLSLVSPPDQHHISITFSLLTTNTVSDSSLFHFFVIMVTYTDISKATIFCCNHLLSSFILQSLVALRSHPITLNIFLSFRVSICHDEVAVYVETSSPFICFSHPVYPFSQQYNFLHCPATTTNENPDHIKTPPSRLLRWRKMLYK